jgi:hypothetical protein
LIEPQKIQWKRLSVEAVAIVASILFAFAIDAWWDDRQKAGDEQIPQIKVSTKPEEDHKADMVRLHWINGKNNRTVQ